jgi:glycosyltransferase involved in cell wall biosynthesis
MSSIKFSIIITCFNKKEFIARAIRSALNQKYIERSKIEVIVIDDCSADSSLEKIIDFENFITIIRNKRNKGLSFSRNKGIKKSRGKYLLMLDGDDYISEDLLYITSKYLDTNKAWDAAATDYITVSSDRKKIKRFSFKENPIACGILYKRKSFLSTGFYDEKFLTLEDVDFNIRFKKKFNIGFVEIPLYRYTMYANNLTKNIKLKKKFLKLLKKKHF